MTIYTGNVHSHHLRGFFFFEKKGSYTGPLWSPGLRLMREYDELHESN